MTSREQKISHWPTWLARVYVGIAKGNLMMGSYLVAIQYDFQSVLNWKLNRTTPQASSAMVPKLATATAAENEDSALDGGPSPTASVEQVAASA